MPGHMKKKLGNKKLTLTLTTVRVLTDRMLEDAGGGMIKTFSDEGGCSSQCTETNTHIVSCRG